MIGSFLTRTLILALGYAYPAYECFKTVESNKLDVEKLRFWCQYWLPMYIEAKLAFYIYLWYPKTKGTTYVYGAFFRTYISKHETYIDRNLLELRVRAGDVAAFYWEKIEAYCQTRFLEILQFVSSRSQSSSQQQSTQES